jgi:hypothetical protein
MLYARCPQCRQTIQVEKVSNDIMMMWHGTHCGSSHAYFAYKDIFGTESDLEKEKPVVMRGTVTGSATRGKLGVAVSGASAKVRQRV